MLRSGACLMSKWESCRISASRDWDYVLAMNTIASDPQAFARLGELIQDINVAMITTVGLDGALHSRPMFTRRLEKDENLWFFTSDDSLKTHEIADEHQVNVTYAEGKQQRYVSVSGT